MKIFIRITVIAIFIPLVFGCKETGQFSSTETAEGILINERGQPVLFFQRDTISYAGTYTRNNYIHPLYAPSGKVLTEDFPDDHLHHRGVFWAWHQVWIGSERIGDPWLCEDFIWDVVYLEPELEKDKITLHAEVFWKSPHWADENGKFLPFVEEKSDIEIFPLENNIRKIDFNISITSLTDSLRIGGSEDSKGYGGFSWRVKLPEELLFYSRNGLVEPITDAIDTGPWIHMHGIESEGDEFGVIVLSHPANPKHPQKWILREKSSMQNVVYPGKVPVAIDYGETISLHYRMVIYDGDSPGESPEECYVQYAKTSK